MRTVVIQQLDVSRDYIPFTKVDQYEFRKDKKWHWLQRACFWVLGKIGANCIGERVEVKQQVIDPKHFADKIAKQLDIGYLFNMDEKSFRIYMGPDDYSEVMKETWSLGYAHFGSSLDLQSDERRKLMGMDVHIVPWMRGILVAP